MTAKLFVALYVGLVIGMFVLMFTNFPVGWIFFAFVFVAVFGGIWVSDRPYLIAAGFLLTSLLVLGIGLFGMYRSWQVNTWPTAAGEITRSWFCTRTTNGRVVYSGACIDYSYRVNGQDFEVSSIDTGEFEQQWWLSIPERFKKGREVSVFYDPSIPTVSRLTSEIPPRDWITAVVGAIMATLAALALWRVFPKPSAGT